MKYDLFTTVNPAAVNQVYGKKSEAKIIVSLNFGSKWSAPYEI